MVELGMVKAKKTDWLQPSSETTFPHSALISEKYVHSGSRPIQLEASERKPISMLMFQIKLGAYTRLTQTNDQIQIWGNGSA